MEEDIWYGNCSASQRVANCGKSLDHTVSGFAVMDSIMTGESTCMIFFVGTDPVAEQDRVDFLVSMTSAQ